MLMTDSIFDRLRIMPFHFVSLVLCVFFIRQSFAQVPPVVPLTNALTAVYCHSSDEPGMMTIRCGANEKIRMLDAFDAAVKNKSHLPIQCLEQRKRSSETNEDTQSMDCKVHTSFTSACSGRENCTLHMQRIRLNSASDHCQNALVDYTMAFFECISDVFIHDVCSSQAITSAWGTIQTPNFPNPYTSSDDCWCKLSTQLQQRLLLSIIVFQLIPYDQHCAGAGLYLQSSNEQQSTQCTYLQQGHNYLSDSNSLYINFYSRTPTVRGGFWIIYEASDPKAEVHLHCGPRDKIGIPSSSNSVSPPPVSTSFDHGWSRLAFNNPPNPTAPSDDRMMHMRLTTTTPQSMIQINSKVNTSTAVGAFTYPHGALATFQVAYGPKGWYLKHSFQSSDEKLTDFLQTTPYQLPVEKWNITWRHTRAQETKLWTVNTVSPSTTQTTTKITTISTTTTATTTTTTTATSVSTTTTQPATGHQRLLFTHSPWVYYSSSGSPSSTKTTSTTTTTTTATTTTTLKPIIKSMTPSPALLSAVKTTLPPPTPWYSPAGPFDWWQWQWYTTKSRKSPINIYPTTRTSAKTSTTRRTSTTMTTTSRSTPTRATYHSNNRTNATVTSTKHGDTAVLPKWPPKESSSNKKKQSDDVQKEHQSWPQYSATEPSHRIKTSTVTSFPIPFTSTRRKNLQSGSFSTTSYWKIITVITPPSKRQHPQQQQHLAVSERTALGLPKNDQVTSANVHNMIRRVIEQRNKKSSMDYGWLSKTDMTIVAVSILFVILLAIINLILFAVRRHRHRLQGPHLLSTSMPSTLEERRLGTNGHLHGPNFGDSTNNFVRTTNNSDDNNDILPAVGEIVIWDEKDQGGYMIDNNGAWAKIEGRQWFGSNIFKSCSKTSLTKSFRSRFRFIRHSDKKAAQHSHQQAPLTPKTQLPQTFKFPLHMDTATLSPVLEADDYESSDLSLSDIVIRSSATTLNQSNKRKQQRQLQPLIKSDRKHDLSPQVQQEIEKTIQALVHTEQQQSDEYYKRIGNSGDDSNYTAMPQNGAGNSSIGDQETDRSLGNEIDGGGPIIVSVPIIIRRDDDAGTITDGADSIYNPNYSIQSPADYPHPNRFPLNHSTGPFSAKPSINTFKPTTNSSTIVGFCQADFQPLDPKLLFKAAAKGSYGEHQSFFRSSQSAQLSTHDSGFVDDQTVGSLTALNNEGELDHHSIDRQIDKHMSMDDILLTKSEDDDEEGEEEQEDLLLNAISTNDLRSSNRQKWRSASKRVSFQEEHVTQRFSPPPPPSSFHSVINPETPSNIFDTYDVSPNLLQSAPPLLRSFFPPTTTVHFAENSPTTSSIFTVPKVITTSIDNEDNADSVIMNHLHSVKSLKKFFETKMVVQQSTSSMLSTTTCSHPVLINDENKLDRSLMSIEHKATDELEQRQEMMNKVLNSLKKNKVYSRTTNDTPEFGGRCSAMTNSSYDSNLTQNLAIQRHYSRRFRSSSTSNNSAYPSGNIVTQINASHPHQNKRAYSHDRQHYQSTDHHMSNIDKWKREQHRQLESDDEDNISENSMLWQARAKLNQFVTRTRKTQQPSPYYTTCTNGETPSEDLYTYDDNESVTAETRF